jgi:hypothetical protein
MVAMKRLLFALLVGMVVVAGCRQGPHPSRANATEDVVGKYAQERGLSREEAEQSIRKEVDAARARGVSSTAGTPASSGVR